MLSPERCPGPEEVEPEEVHERRKCKSGGSARAEGVHERRECTSGGSVQAEGVCRWRKGGVAGGRSGVGHRNVLGHWWT